LIEAGGTNHPASGPKFDPAMPSLDGPEHWRRA
jgi:hypothetical protein